MIPQTVKGGLYMQRNILGGFIGLFALFFASCAFSQPPTLYDDFSGTSIDTTKWVDGDFVKEINGGKLVLKASGPSARYGGGTTFNSATGQQFWHVNSDLNFAAPVSVYSMQADVSVLQFIHTNPDQETMASLSGNWYNDGTPGGGSVGDVWTHLAIAATPGGGLVARWSIWKTTNPQATAWVGIRGGTFLTSISFGVEYPLYVRYDRTNHQFIFRVGSEQIIISTGFPAYASPPSAPYKRVRARVWFTSQNESGNISATFDNIQAWDQYGYEVLNEDFSSPVIDNTRWANYEYVRELSGGQFRSKIRSSLTSSSTIESFLEFVDPSSANDIQATVTPVAYQHDSGLNTSARILGRFYRDGSIPGSGITGDVNAQVGVGWTGTTLEAYWHVNRWLDEIGLNYYTLGHETFTTPVSTGYTYPLSLNWDGTQFTFTFNGETATYTPTGIIAPPNKPIRMIGTRIFYPAGNSGGKEATVEALFDDVMVNNIFISSISPGHGSIGAPINFTLRGGGFEAGATVKLTNFTLINPPNQISIDATNVTVSSNQITGTFNLSGAVPGPWNITVTNPSTDGRSAVLPNGFTVVDTSPPITIAYPVGGTYNAPLSVSLISDESATIYCTTNGSEPNLESPVCSAPINITATTTLKFFARDASGNREATKTEVYTIGGNLTGTVEISNPEAAPGEPIPVTATFTNDTGSDLITIYPDCFNTLFIVTDQATNQPLPPTCRIRGAYIIPSPLPATIPYYPESAGDLTTIKANNSFTVTCDLSEMYHPQILTSNSDGSAKTYSVSAEYANYITDETVPALFLGSINSTEVLANVTIKKTGEQNSESYTSLAVQPLIGLSGSTVNLSATLTSGHRPLSGKTVSFTLNGALKGSATTDALGVATLQVSLANVTAGIYPTAVGANFSGETSYAESGGQAQLTVYNFSSFSAPVDNPPTWNVVKAGQTIPLKWRITDASGRGVTSISSWKLESRPIACPSGSSVPQDLIPATAESSAGSSGLQNLGGGYWQINWKTPKSYSDPAQRCRELILTLYDGSAEKAFFKFNK
jgi:hypothetical protein